MSTADRATALLDLHRDPELLLVVNVWDVISAKVIADLPATLALATASHSIAASHGYEDGENIPVAEMIDAVGRIAAATDLPVTADLEGGYGDIDGTIRAAIGAGIVGANLEDQMRPFDEAVAGVKAALAAAEAEGVPDFVLNARTDAFAKASDPTDPAVFDEAIKRGKAFLEVGAPVVFVPGLFDREQVKRLVDAFGPQKLTLVGIPGTLPLSELKELGVARVSYGPLTQRAALTHLKAVANDIYAGGAIPADTEALN